MTQAQPGTWSEAVRRADHIAAADHHPVGSWDGRAIRGVLTVVLAGVAARQGQTVGEVDTGSVVWHLDRGPSMVYEFGAELGLAAQGDRPEDAAAEWAWLTRRWPREPARANSGGLTRGIGRGSPAPAVDVVTHWAGAAARATLAAERPTGLAPRTRVRVVDGEDKGRIGEVVAPAWLMDDEHRTVLPGPPHGYQIVLTIPGQESGPRHAVMMTLEGDIRIEAPGPHGERVIIRAAHLEPADPGSSSR